MNKKAIFVDTGAWFAVADKSDQFHRKAVSFFRVDETPGDKTGFYL